MAVNKKSISNLRPIKKGEVRNPEGGRAHNKELRAIQRLTKDELAELGSLVLKNNVDTLKAIAKDKDATVLKTMLAALAVRVIQKGDPSAFDALLNRLVGKVTDNVQVTGVHAPQVIVSLPSNGREAIEQVKTEVGKSK